MGNKMMGEDEGLNKGLDIGKINIPSNGEYSDAVLDHETAHQVMASLMDYYIKLHQVVRQKVEYAQTATRKHIKDIDPKDDCGCSSRQKNSIVKKYCMLEKLWAQIIDLLSQPGVNTEAMELISDAVDIIPDSIKAYYDVLAQMDQELQALIEEIGSEEYQEIYHKSKKVTEAIQKGKNILSGLSTDEYDDNFREALMQSAITESETKNVPDKARKNKKTSGKIREMAGKDIGVITMPDGQRVRVLG